MVTSNHHLLLRTHRANLSKSMQWFGATYTNRFNVRHNRSGHLFQGRFKNMLIENDAYLLQLSYYIHRNPLRAKMVKRLDKYLDPEAVLLKAAEVLNCNPEHFRKSTRISKALGFARGQGAIRFKSGAYTLVREHFVPNRDAP